jgi:glucosyl-dolichyl phosphate glucuronosyltransferase
MDLSVVICSYNRYSLLNQSVCAVQESQSFDPDRMELIVVENTPLKQRQTMELAPGTRLVICEEVGLSNARNAGVAASAGEIVAFVDDDAIVGERWCSAVIEAFRTFPEASVCGGRTLPRFSSAVRPRWYYEDLAHHLSCIDWGPKALPLSPGQWIVGANMAFRKKVFTEIGYFDPALGRKGDASLLSNEEIAMLRKVGREHVYYIPDMVVEHIIPDQRLCVEWFRKRVFWQAISDVLSGEVCRTSKQAASELFDVVARMPAEFRGHRLMSFEPADEDQLRNQLKAVYLQGLLMARGFSSTS